MARGLTPDAAVALRAAGEWGVLSLDELLECGLSRDAVQVRARNGWLHRMHRSVYAVGHPNPTTEGRFLGAVKACRPGAVLSHYSAAAHWGILEWDDRLPEVSVVGTAPCRHGGIRAHRTTVLDRRDIARHMGIPLTSPARTLLDLAAILGARGLRRAVRQAQSLEIVNVRQLAEILARLGRGRRGTGKLGRLVATGPAPTRSALEDVVLDLLLAGGLAHPDVNAALELDGRRVVPDFRWAERQLVVEADGAAWHDQKLAREDDAERQALLEAHGERIVRVTWDQAVSEPGRTLDRIRSAGAPSA